MTTLDRAEPLLRAGISVASLAGGFHAVVELHGELCASGVPQLRAELEQLIDDGITDITVDLQHLTLCTSHGLDLFDDIHELLRRRRGGNVVIRLDDATDIVKRVVRLIDENPPRFAPQIIEAPVPDAMAPQERPGDSAS